MEYATLEDVDNILGFNKNFELEDATNRFGTWCCDNELTQDEKGVQFDCGVSALDAGSDKNLFISLVGNNCDFWKRSDQSEYEWYALITDNKNGAIDSAIGDEDYVREDCPMCATSGLQLAADRREIWEANGCVPGDEPEGVEGVDPAVIEKFRVEGCPNQTDYSSDTRLVDSGECDVGEISRSKLSIFKELISGNFDGKVHVKPRESWLDNGKHCVPDAIWNYFDGDIWSWEIIESPYWGCLSSTVLIRTKSLSDLRKLIVEHWMDGIQEA